MPTLSPPLERLLDDCRSEAKRWSSGDPGLLHLAYVLWKKDPEEFAKRLGDDAGVHVQTLLERGTSVGGGQAELLAALEGAPSADATDHLLDVLAEQIPELDEPLAAVGETAAIGDTSTVSDELSVGWQMPTRIARYLELVEPNPVIVDDLAAVDDVLSCIGRLMPVTPLVMGAAGAGRTALITSLANRLAEPSYTGPLAGTPVVRVRPDAVVGGDRANALRRILEDLETPVVAVFDDLEVIASLGGSGADLDSLGVVRAAIESPLVRVVLTIDESYVTKLGVHASELAEEIEELRLAPMPREVLVDVVERIGAEVASHHDVVLDADVVRLSLAPAASSDRRVHPGLAAARLDAACAWAALRQERTVTEADLRFSTTPEIAPPNAAELAGRLQLHVLGQVGAVERVAERLALTRAELDLRPSRPDGVFLFVGPTGVGKTELARAISAELCGDAQALIRLDMSEYAHDWALARLVGPQPGYVGFTEPEGWLTTRIKAAPHAVLLLDEIEKAHPTVWNAFLQVFDAGRLSDARGTVADFGQVIICMTSNLGADAFASAPLGFGRQDDRRDREVERVVASVRATMSPELVNRLDDIVVFEPLSRDAILEIAVKETAAAADRLGDRGYDLVIGADAIAHLADTGYDPAFGARHLQRNIERLLLQPLTTTTGRRLEAVVADGTIAWVDRTD